MFIKTTTCVFTNVDFTAISSSETVANNTNISRQISVECTSRDDSFKRPLCTRALLRHEWNNWHYCNEYDILDPGRRRGVRRRRRETVGSFSNTRILCGTTNYGIDTLAEYSLRHPVSVSIDIVARKWVRVSHYGLGASTGRRAAAAPVLTARCPPTLDI